MHAAPTRSPREPRLPRACAAGALAAGALFALLPAEAWSTILYKSIGPNGVTQFSDIPPENAVIVEERAVPDPGRSPDAAGLPYPGALLAFENPLQRVADGIDEDGALARANAQVDLAEHALALARQDAVRPRGLTSPGRNRADDERIEFYKRNLASARANLMQVLRSRETY